MLSALCRRIGFVVALILCLALPSWAQPPLPSVAPIAEYPEIEGVINQLRFEGKKKLSEQLRDKVGQAQAAVKRRATGYVIVGRVVVQDEDLEPVDAKNVNFSNVFSQTPVFEGGYFATTIRDLNKPVGFAMHGYAVGKVVPGEAAVNQNQEVGDLLYVGDVFLPQLPQGDGRAIKGRIQLEGAPSKEGAKVEFSINSVAINSLNVGHEPRFPWPEHQVANADATGKFAANGLSSCSYRFAFRAPGYVEQVRIVNFDQVPDTVHDFGTIHLERAKTLTFSYLLAQNRSFAAAGSTPQIVRAQSGLRWNAAPHPYGWDVEFTQHDGKFSFWSVYEPCLVADLGEKEIDEVRDVNLNTVFWKSHREVAIIKNHVYLIDQQRFQHLILMKIHDDK
jgi:hypothetical protein